MKARRITAILFTVLFLFIALFSRVYIVSEVNHDCVGEECPICQALTVAEEVEEGISAAGGVIIAAVAFLFAALILLYTPAKNILSTTLISLKVKLSD